ncbi:MAG: alanine racemase [bacterium]
MTLSFSPQLKINLEALQNNYKMLQTRRPPARTAASVKADAYGLGVSHIAPALCQVGCTLFFVAYADEAISLRKLLSAQNLEADIAVFNGPESTTVKQFQDYRLIPVLNRLDQMKLWRPTGRPGILHIDTGMNRLGLTSAELNQIIEQPADWADLPILYIMSHLASASSPNSHQNSQQVTRYFQYIEKMGNVWPAAQSSLSASAGLFLDHSIEENMTRPGLSLYGAGPQDHEEPTLEVVATLMAPILQTRCIKAGETVGYNATYTAQKDMNVATIAIGYGDGIPRSLSNKGHVFIDNIRCPIIGNISMDLMTVDISALSNTPEIGTFTEIFGENLPVEQVADKAGTIAYEIFVRLGPRIDRIFTPLDQ